jgi:hypothetical protein
MTQGGVEFAAAFTQFVRDRGRWRDCEPDALLARWVNFVNECVRGYEGEGEDYFNDLTARDSLEDAMRAPCLAGYVEMADLRRAVVEADEKFQAILRPDAFPGVPQEAWWARGMVRYAGPRLAMELKQTHHVDIAVV